MKQHELDEIQAMINLLKDSKIAKHTDKQLAHYETYKGRKASDATKEKLRQANLGRVMSAESKAKAIAARTGKKMNVSEEGKRKRTDKTSTPINCYDLQGQLIATYESQSEACRQLDIVKDDGTPSVDKIAKGLSKQQKAQGYYWRKSPYKNNIKDEIDALIGNKLKGQTRARAIGRFDLNGNLIEEYPSSKKAGEMLGLCNANINQCCKKQHNGKNATYKGYIWKYL